MYDLFVVLAASFAGNLAAIVVVVWLIRQWKAWRLFVHEAYVKMKGSWE